MKYWIVVSMVWLAVIPDVTFAALPENVCDKFKEGTISSFNEGCRKYLDPLMASYVHGDCKYFQSTNNETRLLDFLENINFVCHKKGNPVCRDIVFLIHTGANAGRGTVNKFVKFVNSIVKQLSLDGSSVHHSISVLSFDEDVQVHVECQQDPVIIDSVHFGDISITNTHLAVDNMTNIMNNCSRPRCAQVGVMLMAGTATNDDSLYDSLIAFNLKHETARLMAIGINKSNNDPDVMKRFKVEVQAIANGAGMSNAIILNKARDLPNKVHDAIKVIAAGRRKPGEDCTQYVTVGSFDHDNDDKFGYHGVYEEDPHKTCLIDERGDEKAVNIFNQLESSNKLSPIPFTANTHMWAVIEDSMDPCYQLTNVWAAAFPTGFALGSTPDIYPYKELEYDKKWTMKMKCIYWE